MPVPSLERAAFRPREAARLERLAEKSLQRWRRLDTLRTLGTLLYVAACAIGLFGLIPVLILLGGMGAWLPFQAYLGVAGTGFLLHWGVPFLEKRAHAAQQEAERLRTLAATLRTEHAALAVSARRGQEPVTPGS